MLELQKIATLLVMPYGLATLGLLALAILTTRKSRFAAPLCFALLAIQLVCGATVVAQRVHYQLEKPYLATRPLDGPKLDTVVVLGGGTGETPAGDAQLGRSGDRLVLAARLYFAGRAASIVCTGSDFRNSDQPMLSPAEEASQILVDLGVPAEALVTVGGRTTAEEMRALAETLDLNRSHGLITSATHMSRALRLAQRAGLTFEPLPADFKTGPPLDASLLDWIPNAESAADVYLGLKEWLAGAVGR